MNLNGCVPNTKITRYGNETESIMQTTQFNALHKEKSLCELGKRETDREREREANRSNYYFNLKFMNCLRVR